VSKASRSRRSLTSMDAGGSCGSPPKPMVWSSQGMTKFSLADGPLLATAVGTTPWIVPLPGGIGQDGVGGSG
jgi:hypothetical protein